MFKVKISGEQVHIKSGTLSIEKAIEERDTCTFQVLDSGSQYDFRKGNPVEIYDQNDEIVFSGIVETSVKRRIRPGFMGHTVSCIDWHYAADKRLAAKVYVEEKAGDVVRDLWESYLEEEGIAIGNTLEYFSQFTLQQIIDGEVDV